MAKSKAQWSNIDDGFDPLAVPRFPVVHLAVEHGPGGETVAKVDGTQIDTEDTEPEAALIQHAAARAEDRPLQAIRASATDDEGQRAMLVVHADGRTWDLTNHLTHEAAAPRRRARRMLMVGGAVGALAIGGVATAGLAGAFDGLLNPEPPAATEPPPGPEGESPVVPVQGWSRHAAWVSPPVARATLTALVGDDLFTTLEVNNEGRLGRLDPTDGSVEQVGSTPITGGPWETTLADGSPGVMAMTAEGLSVWSTRLGHVATLDVAEGQTTAVPIAKHPMVWDERLQTAVVLTADGPKRRRLPAEAIPVTADASGSLIAVDGRGNWWRSDSEETPPPPNPLDVPHPDATFQGIVGHQDRTAMILWQVPGENGTQGTPLLVGYATDDDMTPVWRTPVTGNLRDTMTVSPDGTWGVLGSTHVTIDTGDAVQLPPEWAGADGITDGIAWSLTGQDEALAVTPEGQATVLDTVPRSEAGLPQLVTDDGLAILAAPLGQESRLYALEGEGNALAGRPAGEPEPSSSGEPSGSGSPSDPSATTAPAPPEAGPGGKASEHPGAQPEPTSGGSDPSAEPSSSGEPSSEASGPIIDTGE